MSEMHDVATSEPYLAAPGARDGFQVKGVLKVVDSAGYALFGELAKATNLVIWVNPKRARIATGGSDTASEEAFGEHGRAMPQGAYNAANMEMPGAVVGACILSFTEVVST
ncbi:hypothetical protein DXG01_008700 [Tephrocybe rancida]|nr:hypothetical protein DXG01_008700 [Tephrocybe rancida]